MAPRGTPVKSSPQIKRAISKTKFSVLKTKPTKATEPKTKDSKVILTTRERTKTEPTPKPDRANETRSATAAIRTVPGSVKKLALSSARKIVPESAKKQAPGSASKPAWKRRPKAAHSGVPVPEKMRQLFANLKDDNL